MTDRIQHNRLRRRRWSRSNFSSNAVPSATAPTISIPEVKPNKLILSDGKKKKPPGTRKIEVKDVHGENLSKKQKLTSLFFNFGEVTTSHGACHIAAAYKISKRTTRLRMFGFIQWIVWWILLIIFLGLLAVGVSEVVYRYASYQKYVVPSVRSAAGRFFPAITFCNQNRIKTNISNQMSQLDDLLKFTKLSEEFKEKETYSFLELVQECRFNGMPCPDFDEITVSNLTTTASPQTTSATRPSIVQIMDPWYGKCYTLNIGANSFSGKGEKQSLWDFLVAQRRLLFAYSLGPSHGLSLNFGVDPNTYADNVDSIGLRVVIHNQTAPPFPAENGFDVIVGKQTSVGLEVNEMEVLPTDASLYQSWVFDCNQHAGKDHSNIDDYQKRHGYEYTPMSCSKTCRQRLLVKKCSCYDPHIPQLAAERSSKTCYDDAAARSCMKGVITSIRNHEEKCECPRRCQGVTYSQTISVTDYIGISVTEKLNTTADVLRQEDVVSANTSTFEWKEDTIVTYLLRIGNSKPTSNEGKLVIFFTSFSYRHEQSFEFMSALDLLSGLGGTSGVFLGFSLFTFFEFIVLFIDSILVLIGASKGLSQAHLAKTINEDDDMTMATKPIADKPAEKARGQSMEGISEISDHHDKANDQSVKKDV